MTETTIDPAWEQRSVELWASIDDHEPAEFRERVAELAAETGAGSALDAFERAAAWDSTGHPDKAVPLYQEALDKRVPGERRRRAVIQMSSSLRNLGHAERAVELLTAELNAGSDHLDDAVKTTLALALTDVGREREAVSLVVGALARHLPRYQRSMANYARLLVEPEIE